MTGSTEKLFRFLTVHVGSLPVFNSELVNCEGLLLWPYRAFAPNMMSPCQFILKIHLPLA